MANKFKILIVITLAVSLGAIIHNLTAIPKSYAAPQNSNTFRQILLQSKDKNISVQRLQFTENSREFVFQGKLSDVGDDFIVLSQPNRSFTDDLPTHYIPFTSILRVEKYKDFTLIIIR